MSGRLEASVCFEENVYIDVLFALVDNSELIEPIARNIALYVNSIIK